MKGYIRVVLCLIFCFMLTGCNNGINLRRKNCERKYKIRVEEAVVVELTSTTTASLSYMYYSKNSLIRFFLSNILLYWIY